MMSFGRRLYSIGQDHRLNDYDTNSQVSRGHIETREGLVDMDINEHSSSLCISKRSAVEIYSLSDYRRPTMSIPVSSDAYDTSSTCMTCTNSRYNVCVGTDTGTILLYDIRNIRTHKSEYAMQGKVNRMGRLPSTGNVYVLTDRLDIFTHDMKWLDAVDIGNNGSSLYTCTEDRYRNSIVLSGHEPKIHIIKAKSKI